MYEIFGDYIQIKLMCLNPVPNKTLKVACSSFSQHIDIHLKSIYNTLYTHRGTKVHRSKAINYSLEKNEILKSTRNIGFEEVLLAIQSGNLLDDIEHPNKEKYPSQNIFIILVEIKKYVYLVPYVEDENAIFLKTIIPSRVMTKKYLKENR
jgi:hypothetical protein